MSPLLIFMKKKIMMEYHPDNIRYRDRDAFSEFPYYDLIRQLSDEEYDNFRLDLSQSMNDLLSDVDDASILLSRIKGLLERCSLPPPPPPRSQPTQPEAPRPQPQSSSEQRSPTPMQILRYIELCLQSKVSVSAEIKEGNIWLMSKIANDPYKRIYEKLFETKSFAITYGWNKSNGELNMQIRTTNIDPWPTFSASHSDSLLAEFFATRTNSRPLIRKIGRDQETFTYFFKETPDGVLRSRWAEICACLEEHFLR